MYTAFKMSSLSDSFQGIASIITKETVEKTGAINSVTAIVFDFRGYDTLGESFVLFTAVSGTAVILRKNKRNREELINEKKEI
ncbi:hydrogen gas-evolving membrane-bound hydrogenase subunit E [Clostridium polynesiense]|uniref:hydrogen gas-evolving membrane-bound hydrogenase subunit E n=1 Tax=Clostridium polynesiense TaxID=1325933 RepID=UPI00058B7946|nr:hydrogen gas-evolving membrane-bound hydrogenase subunit E [Clostridium polynesiense]